MNQQIFLAINGLAGRSQFFDTLGVFFAEKFLYVFAIIIVALWLDKRLRTHVYLAVLAAAVSRLFIVEVIKRIVNHPRPYEIVANIHQLLADNEHGMSFPSGHTVIYFSFAFAFYGTKYFWPFIILASLGSLARVYVGVHFPIDIAASVIIAAVIAAALRGLFKKPISS
ncbi:MAG: phosphatase PAP2 family protein [Candidatus Doudnabacteria bacterium]|nr:phosphatase PAP2 family protein [Candidatus Doudnabacteria bacterium]